MLFNQLRATPCVALGGRILIARRRREPAGFYSGRHARVVPLRADARPIKVVSNCCRRPAVRHYDCALGLAVGLGLRLGTGLGRGLGVACCFFAPASGLCCVAESGLCARAICTPQRSVASAPAANSRDALRMRIIRRRTRRRRSQRRATGRKRSSRGRAR